MVDLFASESFIHIFASAATAGAVYGAIRADLRNLSTRITETKHSADLAHNRLDRHIDRHT